MKRLRRPYMHSAFLPPGLVVDHWRVVSRQGRGTYGTVYQVVEVGREQAGPVAFKIAVYEGDRRFEREVSLLGRIHHPSVPRLLGYGEWGASPGVFYPYVVMEWVEGARLYDWAGAHSASSRRVLVMLSQVARALEATEQAGGVHRDVKGANVLVRAADGRAMLTDFGAGHYAGAETLTAHALPPGTPAYRSPEAWQFELRHGHEARAHYPARPTDDLFALRVTAYRLVTGEYPPPTEPGVEGADIWHVEGAGPRPPMALNPRVEPQLSALVLKMLSVSPKARGTVRQMAEALEQAARSAGLGADQPLFGWERVEGGRRTAVASSKAEEPAQQHQAAAGRVPSREASGNLAGALWVAVQVLVVFVVLSRPEPEPELEDLEPMPMLAQEEALDAGAADAGTVGLGDAVSEAPVAIAAPVPFQRAFGADLPKGPLPGQRRPPCGRGRVEINEACWMKLDERPPDCPEGDSYEWRGACYAPVFSSRRPATSNP
ncbi:MAG: serine/threonine protein kinase [Myxococcaceae bacterium]|nr:serine/threonine protein kinase [Myxococcaceae bacterium]